MAASEHNNTWSTCHLQWTIVGGVGGHRCQLKWYTQYSISTSFMTMCAHCYQVDIKDLCLNIILCATFVCWHCVVSMNLFLQIGVTSWKWVTACNPWIGAAQVSFCQTKKKKRWLVLVIRKKTHRKGLEIHWQMFRHFRNCVSNYLRIAKRNYYTSIILENRFKPKLMWECLKRLLIDDQIITDLMSMVNAFNKYVYLHWAKCGKLAPAHTIWPFCFKI